MANRRRNHFVPRFLLNRFASRAIGKKSWVWQLSRGVEPIEISTRDAAVETHFYGGPDTGVEDSLSVAETRFARTLFAIDRGETPSHHAEGLKELVWNLAVRTQALRKQFEDVANRLVARTIETVTSNGVKDAILDYARSEFDQLIERGISSLPAEDQFAARANLKSQSIREAMLSSTEEFIGVLPSLFSAQAFNMLRSQNTLQEASEKGQIEGLKRLLANSKAPDSFSPCRWEVYNAGPLLLGDVCVWVTTGSGEIGSIFHSRNSWHTIYLPISSSQLLVGYSASDVGIPDVERVNLTSAKLSLSHLYCSEVSQSFRELASAIGSGDPIMSEAEMDKLTSDDPREVGEEIVRRLRER